MSYKSIDKFNKSLVEDMTEKSFKYEIYEDEKIQLIELSEKYEIISKNSIQEDIINNKKAIILLYTYMVIINLVQDLILWILLILLIIVFVF